MGSAGTEPLLSGFSAGEETPRSNSKHVSDGKLERILTDDTLPFLRRVGAALWVEVKLLYVLAAPAIFVYVINYVMSMSTQIFSGHLGNLELAAASLGNTGIQLLAYGLMVYALTSLNSTYMHFRIYLLILTIFIQLKSFLDLTF